MTIGYWFVVTLVGCASLAVILGAMSDLAEWRMPRRQRPMVILLRLQPSQPFGPERQGPQWDAAMAAVDQCFHAETFAANDATARGRDIDSQIDQLARRRPDAVLLIGVPELLQAGEPVWQVSAMAGRIAQRLAAEGSHTFVPGVVLPESLVRWSRAAIDATAIAVLTRSWNATLKRDLAPHGGILMTSPATAVEVMEKNMRRPVEREPEPDGDRTIVAGRVS